MDEKKKKRRRKDIAYTFTGRDHDHALWSMCKTVETGKVETTLVKALANEDTLLRTHCYRHKCCPVCPRAQNLLRTQILCPGHKKMFLILFRNILCPQQMFPSLRSPRNIMGNNVSATMCLRLPGP